MKNLTVCAAVFGFLFSASAATFEDISGTTKTYVSPASGVTFGASADATVSLTGAAQDLYEASFNLWVTNCTVTIDASAVAGSGLIRLTGDIVTFGTGKVVVSGVSKLAYGEYAVSAPSLTSMSLFDADFSFANGGELVFTNSLTLARQPACAWSIAQDACIGAYGAGVLGDAETGLVLDHYDLILLDEEGREPSVLGPITVRPGRWLSFKPCSVNCDRANYGYTWSGGTGPLRNDVHLDAGAVLHVPMRSNCIGTLNGTLTGEGEIRLATYNGPVVFAGDSSAFAGDIVVNIADRPLTVSGSFACANLSLNKTGTTVTIDKDASFEVKGAVSGSVSVKGEGTLTVAALADAATVLVNGDVAETMPSEGVLPFLSLKSRLYTKCVPQDGVYDLDAIRDLLGAGSYGLAAQDGKSYVHLPDNVQLTVGAGVTATLLAGSETNATQVAEGGKLIVGDGLDWNWRQHVMKWIDPNVADSITGLTNGNNDVVRRRVDDVEMPWYTTKSKFVEIDTITDCRADRRDWTFQCEKAFSNPGSGVVPLLATNALNGLSVLSFGAGHYARRVSHWACPPETARDAATRPTNSVTFLPKFAVLVFGSQGGGGQGLFGCNYPYYLKRGGQKAETQKTSGIDYYDKDQPIFANNVPTWVDGEPVDATVTPFSGGWEILSVDCSGAAGVGTLGCARAPESKLYSGGQTYGEVLFFDQVLGDDERRSVERYLADRWGLTGQYKGTSTQKAVRIGGAGELKLATDLTVEGSFEGSIDANGRTLSVSDQSVPPGDEVVTAANPDRWFDPEWPGALQTLTYSGREGAVNNFFDRKLGKTPLDALSDGDIYLSACGRLGYLDVGSRGGWATNWISYIGCTGNLRFREKGDKTGETSVYEPMNVKSIFLVQDSTYGGGTPFQTTKGGAPRISRAKGEQPTGKEVDVPIWEGKDDKGRYVYTMLRDTSKSTTRLDGKVVNGSVQGFGGKPEVLSAISTEAFTIGTFADLYYNNDGGTPYPNDCGEVQSEIILFASEISEANRRAIEAYLAWKWLGEVREGYTELSKAQLTGAGTVVVPADRPMPQFGADFTGTAVFAANTFDFTVTDADAAVPVTGLIDVGGGTFAPQSPCALAVTAAGGVRLKSGAFYPLVKGAVADGVELTLNIAADAKGRELKLENRDGVLGLAVGTPGLLLLIK